MNRTIKTGTSAQLDSLPMTPENQEQMQALAEASGSPDFLREYLSVKEVARLLDLSERTIYYYIQKGRLPGERRGSHIVVSAEALTAFQRQAPGRPRQITPCWRQAPDMNPLSLTVITVRQHPDKGEQLESKLEQIRQGKQHHLVGTSARYVVRSKNDPETILLVLVWRFCLLPSEQECRSALGALYADLADVLDWETAMIQEGAALLHA